MKYKTIKLSLLLILLSFSTLKADATKKAFLDVGINSIREWSSCKTGPIPEAKIEEYEQVINDGWRHINIFPRTHKDFSSVEIDFLMIADGEDKKCIRDQLGPGLDLLRKDTINRKRYSRPVIYTWIKKIVKDCSN